MDSACSSGLEALCNAVVAIEGGRCDAALVATVNLNLSPYVSHIVNLLQMLSPEGACKSFDASGKLECYSTNVDFHLTCKILLIKLDKYST